MLEGMYGQKARTQRQYFNFVYNKFLTNHSKFDYDSDILAVVRRKTCIRGRLAWLSIRLQNYVSNSHAVNLSNYCTHL